MRQLHVPAGDLQETALRSNSESSKVQSDLSIEWHFLKAKPVIPTVAGRLFPALGL
jgi:hypothetical protein